MNIISKLPALRRILSSAAVLGLALMAGANTVAAKVYPTRTKGGTKVVVYEQKPWVGFPSSSTTDNGEVIAKYSDLLQKAIAYKIAHSSESVEVRFATYKLGYDLYVGFNAGSSSYRKVADSDFAGSDSEKLIWSFCKAAQAGVNVKIIIHKAGDTSLGTMTGYLDTHGGSNLSYQVVDWGGGSNEQMHNKFLLVNKTRSGSSDYHSVVYTTSANVDDWSGYGPISAKNWQQTGVLVYQNSGVYDAYKKYFDDALWPHASDSNADDFRDTMTALHLAAGGLNYAEDADGISAYFYPVPDISGTDTFWHVDYNPHASVMDMINTVSGVTAPYVKMNQGYLRFDASGSTEFGDKFMEDITTMASVHGIDLSDTSVANVRFVIYDSDHSGSDLSPIASNRISYPRSTHSKNMTYALTWSGNAHYYSTGGSTNAKINGFTKKANNIIMIHEVGSADKEVYQDFKDVFENIF